MSQIQGVLCLRCFLRLWKNNCVSRKPCNVCFIKIRSKHNSNTLQSLPRIFTKQMLSRLHLVLFDYFEFRNILDENTCILENKANPCHHCSIHKDYHNPNCRRLLEQMSSSQPKVGSKPRKCVQVTQILYN